MNPSDAENYPVTGYSITTSGKVSASQPIIFFRIGLKSAYTPTEKYPARYAVILLEYANKTKKQKIFLRQGENADYLMANSDAVSTGGISSRTKAQRISPYNLTANSFNQEIALRGGKFTDYPTQAGAFFQWAQPAYFTNNRLRWAWDPFTSTPAAAWEYPISNTVYWNTLSANNETCPTGYRRFTDGLTTGDEPAVVISDSELRQSLFIKPRIGFNTVTNEMTNSMWGYYADGFFDRRQIVASPNNVTNTTVSAGDRNMAYIGRLFFNPLAGDRFNASLFFPASGFRSYTSGGLISAGSMGLYWSSSASDKSDDNSTTNYRNASVLRIRDTNSAAWRAEKATGAFIRCVRE
jgi:hypothetical protein